MGLLKKIVGMEDDIPEDDGYNGYGYEEEDDGIVGAPDFDGGVRPGSGVNKPNVGASEKVSLKLVQPKSHTEAPNVADHLMDGSIVVLDMGELQKDSKGAMFRLLDFLAGVIHVLDGQMIRTNKTTIVLAPHGVDISGFDTGADGQ